MPNIIDRVVRALGTMPTETAAKVADALESADDQPARRDALAAEFNAAEADLKASLPALTAAAEEARVVRDGVAEKLREADAAFARARGELQQANQTFSAKTSRLRWTLRDLVPASLAQLRDDAREAMNKLQAGPTPRGFDIEAFNRMRQRLTGLGEEPLTWDELGTEITTMRATLPEFEGDR